MHILAQTLESVVRLEKLVQENSSLRWTDCNPFMEDPGRRVFHSDDSLDGTVERDCCADDDQSTTYQLLLQVNI